MIKKLFSKENQTVNTAADQQMTPEKKIQCEETLNKLSIAIEQLEKQSEKIEDKLESLDKEIHNLVKNKKQKLAKNKIMEVKKYKNQLEKFEQQKNVIFGMKIKLETSQYNTASVQNMTDVNKLLLESEKLNDQLSEQMSTYQDFLQAEQEQNQIWKQLENMEFNNLDLDNELDEIEAEIEMENQLNNNVDIKQSIPALKTQQSSKQQKSNEKLLFN